MKKINLAVVAGLLLILITGGLAMAGQNGRGKVTGQQVISEAEIADLLFLREE